MANNAMIIPPYLAPDLAAQQADIERRKIISDLLLKQSMEPSQGQMVSGHYVPPSFTQGLAKAYTGYVSGQLNKQAATDLAGLDKQKFKAMSAMLGGGQTRPVTPDNAALAMALGAKDGSVDPTTANAQRMDSMPAQEPKAPNSGYLTGNENLDYMYFSADPKGYFEKRMAGQNPEIHGAPFTGADGQMYTLTKTGKVIPLGIKDREEVVETNGQLRSKYGTTPLGVMADPNKPFAPTMQNGQVGIQSNQPFQNYELNKAQTGATRISMPVNVNTEKTYAGNMAEGLAKQDISALDAAKSATQRIANAQAIRKTLDTLPVITGTGADARLAINNALSTAGLIDGRVVTNTQDLSAMLGRSTLDAIHSSGLGTGNGFTDKDLAFLSRARSGTLESTPDNLRELSRLNERVARIDMQRGQKVANNLKGNKSFGSVGQDFNFEQPPEYAPASQAVQTPAPQAAPSAGPVIRRYNQKTGRVE